MKIKEHLKKGVPPPPKTLTKWGTELFADGDVHVLRQIDSKSKSTAFVVLPGLLPTIQRFFSFFSSVLRVNEIDRKWGVTKYLFLECLREGIPRRLY